MQKRWVVIGGAVAVAAVVATVGVVRQVDRTTTPAGVALPSTSTRPSATPAPSTAPIAALQPVLEPADLMVPIDTDKLAARIEKVGGIAGGKVSAAVLNAEEDDLLYAQNAATPLIPASTNKVLTAAAALELMGPTHRFTTSVVSAELTAAKPKITLVGGGDPYLASTRDREFDPGQASLEDLAARTAKKLKRADVDSVTLGYDESLFSGPAWNSRWPEAYRSYVTPTTALWADEGQLAGPIGPRHQDPADVAADLFADQLRAKGIKVGKITEGDAPKKAASIAKVESLSLERIVERLLMSSDNDASEVVARHVALAADRPGSITEATTAIRQTLTEAGAWIDDSRSYDGSGLARDTQVSAEVLARVVQLAVSETEPRLGPVLTGLPVAGVEGSLKYRFDTTGAEPGQGTVRAKTGTLTKVRSLAGYAYTRDGELLVFAVVVNGVANDYTALTWLDRIVAAIAACGCKA